MRGTSATLAATKGAKESATVVLGQRSARVSTGR